MATTDFIPTRESELVVWSNNFGAQCTTLATSVGLTVAQCTAFNALNDSWVAAYAVASTDATNSRSARITKNTAKHNMIANARLLAGIIQKFPGTTDTMRATLGLTVPDRSPAPIPAPAVEPGILIEGTNGNTVSIRLIDKANPTRRSRPAGTEGAAVFTFIGATAPTDENAWTFQANTSRTSFDVVFPSDTAPGARVWFTAMWFNQRKQSSPAAAPVGTNIPGNAAMSA